MEEGLPSPLVQSPTEGQNLQDYLQGFTDAQIRQIHSDPESLTRLCTILQDHFKNLEQIEDSLEKLWNIIKRVNNFDRLLYFIRRLERTRRLLLEALLKNEQDIQEVTTLSTVGRLVGSTVDVVGTVGGLLMTYSNPGYANLAFRTATAFGLMGLVSTISEMTLLKNRLGDLMKLIERDQRRFSPIQLWYQQTKELQEAMQDVFQFDVTSGIVSDFVDTVENEITPVNLLATLLSSVAEQDIRRTRDGRLIQNLINFTLHPASQDWFEWMILRRHPLFLDISRMLLQLQYSPLRFALSQSIPALAMADQSIQSFPVWGRISLNIVSIIDSIRSLQRSDMPTVASEMRRLRKHLSSELVSLQRIAEFIQLRRGRD